MANLDAKNYVLKNSVPSQKVPPFEEKGATYIAYDEITFTGNVAVNDIIRTSIVVPKGAIIKEAGIISPSLGTTGTFQLGTATVPNSLVNAANAGGQAVKGLADAVAVDLFKKMTEDTNYQVKCTVVTTAATGLTMKIFVEFAYIGG